MAPPSPYEGDIDPSQLTQALAKGAREKGAEISRFKRTAAGEWAIETSKGRVTCETVVNTTGFYGNEIAHARPASTIL